LPRKLTIEGVIVWAISWCNYTGQRLNKIYIYRYENSGQFLSDCDALIKIRYIVIQIKNGQFMHWN
jgi:hypothetical protein